jgi:NAD(P)-dependent dehydrogenase (short-subunit alcohol dehydrogenase family)
VTGCSSGIGAALCTYIATQTTNRIVATARNPSKLSYLPTSPNVLKVALDVTSPASIQAALSTTLSEFKRIDVFVNNAGYCIMGDAEGYTDASARAQLETNFWGSVSLTKAALPILRDENPKSGQRGGVIVQVSSMGGRMGAAGHVFYNASKWALEGYTEAFADELDEDWNVHFCIVEPGGVKTEYAGSSMQFEKRHPAYADPKLKTNVILGYLSNPEAMKNFAEASAVAEAMYRAVKNGVEGTNGGKGGIPFRLPLGADSWAIQKMVFERDLKELETLKEISYSTSGEEQLKSLSFLKK